MAEQFDVEYDLVVIGSGASGKSAAFEGARQGLSVVVLEKAAEQGGTSNFAEGQTAFESSEQKARGVPEYNDHYPSRTEGFNRYMDYSSKRCNPEVVRMQVNNTAETIDLMKSLGIVYTYVGIYAYDQPAELNTFHRPEGLGAHMQEVLYKACVDAGVEFFFSTPAKSLIKDGDAVVGVVAEDSDGKSIRIGAKAVVIASGGFGGNDEMIEQYSRFTAKHIHHIEGLGTNNTGDGANMAIAAGAGTWEMGCLMLIPTAHERGLTSHISGAGMQPVLYVNKKGQRFWDEHCALSFADWGNVLAAQEDGVGFAIFDAAQVAHLVADGSDIGLGDFIEYHQKLVNLPMELDEAVAEGVMAFQADSIEELGAALGLDPAAFAAVVERYNGMCDAGFDEDFFKKPEFLRPVRQGPFYAVEMNSAVLVSTGALHVNGNMQVIAAATGEPIPGLYAAGMDAGGLFGDAYNLDVPGSANGFSHAGGRVAARHAASVIKG
ncbi:MAG: FAD-dependent oxidoreductase [Bifidobacteriaceae bacterium]|jgi:fumarate reductase flavoprotein subunit|nr:FAD-dependent oxidoreductase [Bifidobacteriaceae bacterium]